VLTNATSDPTFYQKISNSELYSLNRCKKLHDYSYRQGLVPTSTPNYLTKGSFFHSLIAAYLVGADTDLDSLSKTIQKEAMLSKESTVDEPTRTSTVSQLTGFFKEMGVPSRDSIVAVEEEFYADIGLVNSEGEPVLLHGFVDAVIRDDAGNLWLVEHKTAARAWSAQQFQFAIQDVLYCAAWEALTGKRPVGIQYNFFYPKRWEVRTKYIEEAQYASVIADVQASIDLRDNMTSFPRESLWGCSGCQFRDLCYTELTGGDGSYLRQTQFTVDQEKANRFLEVEA